ncbi:CHAD domain-containing protein [Streptomyces tendae]|uniref:CHAD domain-containing protein n=1 Tax=Streptomyces tendae TaxID=1932 RepID=A0ABX5ZYE0_STRTE|nr:CHAD domain-containing protein [Streptomyces tendae]
MAQQHHDPTAGPVPADVLARHLRDRATEFLRALRLHRESGAGAASEDSAEAARALRRAARRISAGLYTFQPVLDPAWSQALGPELAWVSGTLSLEDACASRLDQLLLALHRLSGTPDTPPGVRLPRPGPHAEHPRPRPPPRTPGPGRRSHTHAADGTPPDVPRTASSASGAPAPARPGPSPPRPAAPAHPPPRPHPTPPARPRPPTAPRPTCPVPPLRHPAPPPPARPGPSPPRPAAPAP